VAKPSKADLRKQLLLRGVEDVIERAHLTKALSGGKRLRVKLGIDPTSPDLHVGNAVVLRKLKQFQDLGHKIILIVGDFTAQVGDPSDQDTERKALSKQEIKRNMKNYLAQVGKIIDIKKTEIRHNSEWLGESVEEILRLTGAATINQVIGRADFQKRIKNGQKVSLMEALYSLLQGYDSVKVRADVELGGTDQLLNLLMGRQVQRYYGQAEQDILTVPLLEGTDGVKKMSKSYDNYIGLNDSPSDMFGKVMSIKDSLIVKYFVLCTDVPMKEISGIEKSLEKRKTNPRDVKARLAYEIVKLYHGGNMATAAEQEFNRVFQKKRMPSRIPTKKISKKTVELDELIVITKSAKSKSEASRLISQGAVRIDDARVLNPKDKISIPGKGIILQVGKRRFFRVKS
jgi:tyrosyl-tRNA synthetase